MTELEHSLQTWRTSCRGVWPWGSPTSASKIAKVCSGEIISD
ncbi:rCG52227 [Rattus norvegicus]|uniref:RCG52227 n=1 Tax=Rattus norvegicus TaxID=10116 RepID=A6K6E8_RAT|nr:rCG52227 [Rattus norvegicus]